MDTQRKVDVVILGAGTAGSYAMAQVRRAGKSFVLINGGSLGTTCARVGCMPSKMLIQAADLFHDRHLFDELGIRGAGGLRTDIPAVLRRVRALRNDLVSATIKRTVGRLDEGQFIDGYARLVAPNAVEVAGRRIEAEKIIIATGSSPIVPQPWRAFGERVITTDELFELDDLPRRMAVIGLGAVGLEMGQALARLGVEVTGFDALDRIAGLTDPALNRAAIDIFGEEFPMHLGREATVEEVDGGALRVSAGEHRAVVDAMLVCIGRRPNLGGLGLEDLGVPLDAHGRPLFDQHTMRVGPAGQIGDLPLFLAGDVTGDRPIMHEAADEGRIAGYNVSKSPNLAFWRKTPLAIVFTDPNIALVGARWDELDEKAVAVGEMDFAHQSRARVMGKNRGLLRLYGERSTGRILGAAMCAPGGEHLAHLLAWCIPNEFTAFELQQMPYYHPVLEEGLGSAVDALAHEIGFAPTALPHVSTMVE